MRKQRHWKKSTQKLKGTVNVIESDINELKRENKLFRESILDIQTRSMHENLVLTGLKEDKGEDSARVVKDFIVKADPR